MRFLVQNGFSIVQGMILAGIVAGSSLVATRLLTDQKLAQKGAETRDLIEDFHQVIAATLQNRENCKQTINGNGLQLALGTSTSSHAITSILTKDNQVVANAVDAFMNHNVRIRSMVLAPPGTGADLGTRTLNITYERLNSSETARTKKGYGAKSITKPIKLRISKTCNGHFNLAACAGTEVFAGCYAKNEAKTTGPASLEAGNDIAKQVCDELIANSAANPAFEWDETNSVCRPTAKCDNPNQVYVGINSNGDVICKFMHEWVDLNNVLDWQNPVNCPPGSTVGLVIDDSATAKLVKINCNPP